MKTFLHPLQNLAEMEAIYTKAKSNRGILEISGCMESQKAHLIYGLSGLFTSHLILAEDEKAAKELYEDYRFYDKNVYYYPAKDLLFFQADIHGNLLLRQRMRVIKALLEQKENITVVTSIDGCMDYLQPLDKIEKQLIHFRNDSTLDMDKLKDALVHMGYERVGQVEMPGQFSVRGGIVDIYSLTEENPWRIELWSHWRSNDISSLQVQIWEEEVLQQYIPISEFSNSLRNIRRILTGSVSLQARIPCRSAPVLMKISLW